MAKDFFFNLVLLITLVLDLASSLYLSQDSAIKNVGDTFIVICKDKERGLPVSWRGPKNMRLGQKTRPKVQTSSFGTVIMFNNAREEDSGNYTCSTSGPIQEKNVFTLKVEAEPTTVTEFLPVTFTPTEETYVTPQVITHTTYHEIHHDNEAPPEEVHLNLVTTELVETTEVVETVEMVETIDTAVAETIPRPEVDVDVNIPSTTVETIINTTKTTSSQKERPKYKNRNNYTTDRNHKKVKPIKDDLKFVDTAKVQYLTEGDRSGVLRCETNKNATINWFHNNKSVIASGNESFSKSSKFRLAGDGLIISNVTRHDAGIYVCEAIHGSSGGLKSEEIEAIVQHKPSAVVMAEVNVVYGLPNTTVNLTCEVEAVPTPRFIWSTEDADVDLSSSIINETSHKSILQINVTDTYDTPVSYKCVAINKMGEEDIYFTVQPGVLPDIPVNTTILEATSNSLTLDLGLPEPSEDVEKYDVSPTYFIVKYREQGSEEDWTSIEVPAEDGGVLANLTDLKKRTTYDIQVATKNVVGLSDFFSIQATTSAAMRSVQATVLVLLMSVVLSILLPEEMRKA